MNAVPASTQSVRAASRLSGPDNLCGELAGFDLFGKKTNRSDLKVEGAGSVPVFTNEFWTSKQRAASSLHEISYRACFKPQLPRFFIERLTRPGDVVYDPFMGRGTTLLESALLGRTPWGCDANPLGEILAGPRLRPPSLSAISERLAQIDFSLAQENPEDLLAFYHPETLKEICALKFYLLQRQKTSRLDFVDRWIRMVATNRLTGHSPGFFSVYTLPPNQAVSAASQRKINARRKQTPSRKSVLDLILRKSAQLLRDVDETIRRQLFKVSGHSMVLTQSASATEQIPSESAGLVVTSPPFLDVVNYEQDNWLRAWFCGLELSRLKLWQFKNLSAWEMAMSGVLAESHRILKPGGCLAFEVGEIRSGRLKLETSVLKTGLEAGFNPVLVLINDQVFTKTSNCWGVQNQTKGTNTNRIVLFQK
jgi:hypothetical protein